MANDTQIVSGSGDLIRDFDDGTRKWPVGFIAFGVVSDPGPISAPTVVSSANPFPVTITSSQGNLNVVAVNREASLSAGTAPSKMTVIGGQFNATAPSLTTGQTAAIQVNAHGAIYVDGTGVRATYAASGVVVNAPGVIKDFLTLYGASGKVIRLLKAQIQTVTSNASNYVANISLIKRSATNTGGTFASVAVVPLDSNSAAPAAILNSYSAAATTLGTQVGIVNFVQCIQSSSPQAYTTGNSLPTQYSYDGTSPGAQPVTLRSASEGACFNDTINNNGPNASYYLFNIIWSEDVI